MTEVQRNIIDQHNDEVRKRYPDGYWVLINGVEDKRSNDEKSPFFFTGVIKDGLNRIYSPYSKSLLAHEKIYKCEYQGPEEALMPPHEVKIVLPIEKERHEIDMKEKFTLQQLNDFLELHHAKPQPEFIRDFRKYSKRVELTKVKNEMISSEMKKHHELIDKINETYERKLKELEG